MIPNRFSALVEAPQTCARIVAHDRDSYRIANENFEIRAELSGRFRYENTDPNTYPVVGDYVAADTGGSIAMISSVLPRDNLFARRGVFGSYTMQAIAANLDTLFLVMAVNRDFNLRRLERYLIAAVACEVPCVITLSKVDLSESPSDFIAEVKNIAGDTPIVAISALNQLGLEALQPYRGQQRTIAFVGSSGVGKSTLINSLLDQQKLAVSEIRNGDDRGRHTTTRRCLLYLEDGTAIIDTPGMREFALADAESGVDAMFSDLSEIAASCRFRDCKHNGEPGCAVIENIDEDRLQNWRKLEREAAFEARKTNRLLANAEKKRWKAIHKEAKKRTR